MEDYVSDHGPLTHAQAHLLLAEDLALAEHYALRRVRLWRGSRPWLVPERLLQVLIEMHFVLGPHGVAGFAKFGRAIGQGQWGQAANELRSSVWAEEAPERVAELAVLIDSLNLYADTEEQ